MRPSSPNPVRLGMPFSFVMPTQFAGKNKHTVCSCANRDVAAWRHPEKCSKPAFICRQFRDSRNASGIKCPPLESPLTQSPLSKRLTERVFLKGCSQSSNLKPTKGSAPLARVAGAVRPMVDPEQTAFAHQRLVQWMEVTGKPKPRTSCKLEIGKLDLMNGVAQHPSPTFICMM